MLCSCASYLPRPILPGALLPLTSPLLLTILLPPLALYEVKNITEIGPPCPQMISYKQQGEWPRVVYTAQRSSLPIFPGLGSALRNTLPNYAVGSRDMGLSQEIAGRVCQIAFFTLSRSGGPENYPQSSVIQERGKERGKLSL